MVHCMCSIRQRTIVQRSRHIGDLAVHCPIPVATEQFRHESGRLLEGLRRNAGARLLHDDTRRC